VIRAMIFDLDGTLVQTERLKARSYAAAAVQLRPELDASEVIERFKDVVGRPRREVAQYLLREFDLGAPATERMTELGVASAWQAYVQIRLDIYNGILADDRMLLEHRWPHTLALLDQARRTCDKLGLASMSDCTQVRRVLRILGLADTFDFVASRDDVERGKPDPEIYLLVARELNVSPDACLVIEDSATGVEAALAAGMRCVAVSTPFTRASLHSSGLLEPRWIVDDPAALFQVVDRRIRENERGSSPRPP